MFHSQVRAGILDDIGAAIAGHAEDVQSRFFHDDEYIPGDTTHSGRFRDTDPGRDGVHWADGSVSIVVSEGKTFLQLGNDFKTGLAPDLYIYTATSKVVDEASFDRAENLVELGKLRSGSGAQVYDFDHEFTEVIIWCKRFHQFMGAATLKVI